MNNHYYKKEQWQRKFNRPKREYIKNHNQSDFTKKLFSPDSEEERHLKTLTKLFFTSKTVQIFQEPDSIWEKDVLTSSRAKTPWTILDTELCGVKLSEPTDTPVPLEPVSERTSQLKLWDPTSEWCSTQTKPCELVLSINMFEKRKHPLMTRVIKWKRDLIRIA